MASSFLPPAIFEIKAIADEAIAKFGDVNKELEKMEGQAEKAGGKVGGIEKASRVATAGLLAMGAAFVGFASYGIKEAIEAENALNKLGTTLGNLGLSTQQNRDQIKQLTDSYVDLGFGGEEAAAGFDVLLRATGSLDESQKLLAMSADLARVKNIGLSEASSILAKASQGNAKAFKEMGITLDETLPKNEALNKAMAELNAKIGGQAIAYTETFQGKLAVTKEKFNDVAETLGSQLLPYLKQFLDFVAKSIEFVQKNSSWLKILAGIVITVTVALASYNATVKAITFVTNVWTKATAFAQAVLALFTKQQQAANAAMKANPIGLVVSAVMLLIGAFVMLWNKSEAFRKMVIQVGKAGLTAFASIVPMVGQVFEAILKIVTGPMRAFLGALSKLPGVGKYAKGALDLINKGLDGVSNFADSAAKKASELSKNLDKLNKPIKIGGGKGIEIPEVENADGVLTGGKGKKGETKAQKKLREDNEKYMKIVKDLNDKVAEAQKDFTEEMASIDKNYNERVTKLNKDATERKAKLQKDANEKIAKLESNAAEARAKALETKNNKIKEAQERFNDVMADLNKKRTDDLTKLEKDNAEKIANITKEGNDKLQAIIEEGINRLRNAYKTGTQFNVGDLFKGLVENGKASADELLKTLKTRLDGARKLAQNASLLASKGFTQTFIEQVVSQGPEIGNQLSESLLSATPETISALQQTYMSLEDISDTGLDVLAKSMNNGANFATAQLAKAYEDAREDTRLALAKQNADYLESQTEINKVFNESMLEAEKTRDSAIAQANADFDAAIKEINKNLEESLAEVNKDLAEALAEVDKELTEALAEAHKDMVEAQEAARKKLSESLAAIQKEFDEKLGNIKNAIASTLAAIAQLQAAMASANSMASSGSASSGSSSSSKTSGTPYVPITSIDRAVKPDGSIASWRAGEQRSWDALNITQNFTATKVDSHDVHEKTIAAMKLGSTVTVPSPISRMTASLRSRGID